jgi:hypothetical protein
LGRSPALNSGELRIQKNELRDISVVGLQLDWIRLITGRVTAPVPKVKSSLQVLVLRIVQIGKEAAE